jgi:hypothetical protein
MKKFIMLAGVALMLTSPAFARSQSHHAARTEPTASAAYAAQSGTNVATRSRDLVVNGQNQGTDPNPLVRLDLQRDPPMGGSAE